MEDPAKLAGVKSPEPEAESGETESKRRGRQPASGRRAASAQNTAPDWLYHRLTISGPTAVVEDFARAARGPGATPRQLDAARTEEDNIVRAVSQPAPSRSLTVAGCRILARQLRGRIEAHHAVAAARVGHSQACPFDLHHLLPVPKSILQLGGSDPAALAWMAAHWGVTDRLHQVSLRAKPSTGQRLPRGHAVISYGFFTRGDSPHAAVGHFEQRWPALRFWLVPRPAD